MFVIQSCRNIGHATMVTRKMIAVYKEHYNENRRVKTALNLKYLNVNTLHNLLLTIQYFRCLSIDRRK